MPRALPLAEEMALQARLRELRRASHNAYQQSFHRFLTECVYTIDEAAGGEFALFPDDQYIRQGCDLLMVEPLLLCEKSRRVRWTWLCSALEVWICAGGRDPRWPALLKGSGHRQCIIISKKEEDADFVIDRRTRIIYEQLWEHGIGEMWPGFPTCRFSYTEANWSNGSQIKALPQGPDQVRQFGATMVRYEEMAHSPAAKDTLAAALPLLQGKDGSGGHLVGVCTPNATSHARDIRDDVPEESFGSQELRTIDWPALQTIQEPAYRKYVDLTLNKLRQPEPGHLLPTWRTRSGWCVVQVPWLAVPGYNIKKAMAGQVTEQDKRREYCLDWDASTGKLVLPEFAPHIHVSDHELEFYPDLPLLLGWDLPGHPACLISQIDPYGRWFWLSALCPPDEETVGVYEFGQRVASHLLRCYAQPNEMELRDLSLYHYGDPAGAKLIPRPGEAPQEARSCFDILDRGVRLVVGHDGRGDPVYEDKPGWGWRVLPGEVGITARLEALRARLTMLIRGEPGLVVCRSNKLAIKALASYQYRELPEGRYSDDPKKDWASHLVDAGAYVATRLNSVPKKKGDHAPVREPVVSRAATKSRGR